LSESKPRVKSRAPLAYIKPIEYKRNSW
jgi:hypothetical protein